jgi:1-acyl-sn-glycerol-3-phosphate acyltransferase
MIIKARHHFIIYPFIKLYTVFKIRRHFKEVIISGVYHEKNLPLLLISNHISWWDGFWIMYLNLKIFQRKFHFMMLEEQLRKFSIFKYCGGYSIKKGSRSALESISYTVELLSDKNNLVMLFPQGKITSVYNQSYIFEKGLERILREADGRIQIIFIANLTDYFSNEKPTLFTYYQEYKNADIDVLKIQDDYNRFYSRCIEENIKAAD